MDCRDHTSKFRDNDSLKRIANKWFGTATNKKIEGADVPKYNQFLVTKMPDGGMVMEYTVLSNEPGRTKRYIKILDKNTNEIDSFKETINSQGWVIEVKKYNRIMRELEGEVIITREYLISLLKAWEVDKITAADVYETANRLFWPGEFQVLDWEENENSVTHDMLEYLDSLNINCIVQEDIVPALEFLHTPIDQYAAGSKKWQQYKASINYDERIKQLKGHPPYTL